jgi:hypothetical protein
MSPLAVEFSLGARNVGHSQSGGDEIVMSPLMTLCIIQDNVCPFTLVKIENETPSFK